MIKSIEFCLFALQSKNQTQKEDCDGPEDKLQVDYLVELSSK